MFRRKLLSPAANRRLGFIVKGAVNIVGVLYSLALLALLLLHWGGYDRHLLLAFLILFLPFYFLPVFGLLLLSLSLRARAATIATVPLALIGLVLFAPFFLPKPSYAASPAALHVITFNVSNTNEHMDQVVAWLRDQHADIVLLQEVSAEWFGPLYGRMVDLYPYQVHQLTEQGFRGNLTLSRFPVAQVPSVSLDDPLTFQPVILDVEGQTMSFYNVALLTPVDELPRRDLPFEYPILDFALRYDDTQRNQQIDRLLSQVESDTPPYIVAGDFNMADQASSYPALAAHLGDSFREAGTDMGMTWPAFQVLGLPAFLPPLIRIDYVWHSTGFRVISAHVGPYLGSDHRPVDVVLDRMPATSS